MSLEHLAGAWKLLGMHLPTGWKVIEPIGWDPNTGLGSDHYNGTGGHFSVPYIVEKDNKRAFLKAIDLTSAMHSPNALMALHAITSAHSFEALLLEICEGEKMDRVVVALESGQLSTGINLQDKAPYLIFELADGDVRRRVQKVNDTLRLSWWLHAMHQIAVGLQQLHSRRIAHQDLKPSNVLAFGNTRDFRVADLGRAICDGTAGPHDDLLFSGDYSYAPPEILYAQIDPDFAMRRLGCDLYLLGSMIFFFATGFGCTQQLVSRLTLAELPPSLRGTCTASYVAAMPVIQHHFTDLLSELKDALDPSVADDLTRAASELCNPDPVIRGHPLDRVKAGNRFSLERYIAIFDRLAKRADLIHRVAI
ncbi:protein kinase domain-containing protein [Rhizobium ruizarguesonis]|uniref:protein kinase domain-containing protein n=1 Tax=Rhizobium ruizarguesonis TaxID=2081791 RepID=UPI000369462F|nr:protein kinase [Rhizobium ruizarguesonis]MCB2400061.1 protein kinase [Rhizobium ruizarguesonis]